ncbi:immune inhibitor A [bacterium]|nr:immune inhibitor A [bacterium]
MKKYSTITLLLFLVITLVGEVIPHPMMNKPVSNNIAFPSEKFPVEGKNQSKELPENVLVYLVQFSDVSFVSEPSYPDSLVHDQAFFDRYMLQLSDYLYDASHQQYSLNYHFYPQVITLDNEMSYYGSDTDTRQRIAEFAQEIVQKSDNLIDFNEWDTFIVFHAGAGQESDIERIRPGLIWSTFLSRRNLQLGLDPENNDFLGIPADGTHVTDFVIAPEHQWQDYFPEDGSQLPYGNLGVLASGFGYALGLPNLSDTISENGPSAGIGNWGIMGSGAWNANGYTPAQLSAWSRYYLGWETPIEVSLDTYNLEIDHFLEKSPTKPQLYKVNMSEKEYFLIENRSQNPDNSTLNGQANFTFALLPEGEQEYYPLQDGQWELVPKFDFMKNRLKGCEWDFFLPGYSGGGYMPVDGSGLLIWHIDEFIIEENFNPDIGLSRVNGDANHKGVDLEEADGIQHLDSVPGTSIYSYGGPEDAFRAYNNTYIGFSPNPNTGFIHLPSAESYYGGIPFEIFDISEASNTMTFSVNFKWNLSTNYNGLSLMPAISLDMNDNGINEIIFPNGNMLTIFEEDEVIAEYGLDDKLFRHQSYDEISNTLLLPTQKIIPSAQAFLNYYDGEEVGRVFTQTGYSWTSPVVIHKNEDDNLYKYFCALNDTNSDQGLIKVIDSDFNILTNFTIPGKMKSNLLHEDQLMVVTKDEHYYLNFIDQEDGFTERIVLDIPADSLISNILYFDFNPTFEALELLVQGPYGFYTFTSSDNLYSRISYLETGVHSQAVPSLVDYDKNGTWDLVLGHKDGIKIMAYNGELIDNNKFNVYSTPNDSLIVYGGAYAVDLDNNQNYNFIGSFSRNRSSVWDAQGRTLPGFPQGNYSDGRTYPFLHIEDNQLFAYTTLDRGTIDRAYLRDVDSNFNLSNRLTGWFTEYNNYHRNAVEENRFIPNSYETQNVFVKGQVYIYPNPFNATINDNLYLRAMVSRKCQTKLEIFSISGKKVYSAIKELDPYIGNMNKFEIPYKKLASGVYFAIINAEGQYKKVKFALEK